MSLLQDVLKQRLEAVEDAQNGEGPVESDDDEMIDVASGTNTPLRSRVPTRSGSPTRAGKRTLKPSSLAQSSLATDSDGGLASEVSKRVNSRDPLRFFPDKIRPIIFCMLSPSDLASCTLVSQRWKKSQTINHAWYQVYRHETYQFSDLPVGKWTKRESKRDWRTELIKARRIRDKEQSHTPLKGFNSRPRTPAIRSGTSTPLDSDMYHRDGHLTPREAKEEEWARQEQQTVTPDKVTSRAWYKEVGGKRVKKTKAGMAGGMRDRTAWEEEE